ncbi:MAG: hypothetical protein AVDCRST_MAG76-2230, partial [uncultured Acidimicrobiales bacterium]
ATGGSPTGPEDPGRRRGVPGCPGPGGQGRRGPDDLRRAAMVPGVARRGPRGGRHARQGTQHAELRLPARGRPGRRGPRGLVDPALRNGTGTRAGRRRPGPLRRPCHPPAGHLPAPRVRKAAGRQLLNLPSIDLLQARPGVGARRGVPVVRKRASLFQEREAGWAAERRAERCAARRRAQPRPGPAPPVRPPGRRRHLPRHRRGLHLAREPRSADHGL